MVRPQPSMHALDVGDGGKHRPSIPDRTAAALRPRPDTGIFERQRRSPRAMADGEVGLVGSGGEGAFDGWSWRLDWLPGKWRTSDGSPADNDELDVLSRSAGKRKGARASANDFALPKERERERSRLGHFLDLHRARGNAPSSWSSRGRRESSSALVLWWRGGRRWK